MRRSALPAAALLGAALAAGPAAAVSTYVSIQLETTPPGPSFGSRSHDDGSPTIFSDSRSDTVLVVGVPTDIEILWGEGEAAFGALKASARAFWHFEGPYTVNGVRATVTTRWADVLTITGGTGVGVAEVEVEVDGVRTATLAPGVFPGQGDGGDWNVDVDLSPSSFSPTPVIESGTFPGPQTPGAYGDNPGAELANQPVSSVAQGQFSFTYGEPFEIGTLLRVSAQTDWLFNNLITESRIDLGQTAITRFGLPDGAVVTAASGTTYQRIGAAVVPAPPALLLAVSATASLAFLARRRRG